MGRNLIVLLELELELELLNHIELLALGLELLSRNCWNCIELPVLGLEALESLGIVLHCLSA